MDFNIVVGGEAGQGLKTVDAILGKILFKMGYNVFSSKDYMSRIRGGHNFISIRFGTKKIEGSREEIDLLIALNEKSIELHKDKIKEKGILIYDGEPEVDKEVVDLSAKEIASEVNKKGVNTVFIGAALKLMGFDISIAEDVIRDYFSKESIQEDNLELLRKGYDSVDSCFALEEGNDLSSQIYIEGNDALAMGAAAAGLKFYAAYPMSPSTGIMNYLAGKQEELDMVVEQAEDEIAAINMALGGSYSGVRSMTGTSGGGFALMTEAIGLAGIAEIPIVVADIQRPGPATGLPTRTGQGDLLFAINAAQDDFPIMVMAPRDHKDLFYQAFRAFNIADKYQMPVIILSDQYLADSAKNLEAFDFDSLKIDRALISEDELEEMEEYKRYLINESGISPRAYPGQLDDQVVLIDSDEHDEDGHIIEDADIRNAMVEKRIHKVEKFVDEDLKEPVYIGSDKPDTVLLCWGSTYGVLTEAREILKDEEINVGILSFSDLWPLPTRELNELIDKDVSFVSVENNSTGQLAQLISSQTRIKIDKKLLKYDGRPFSAQEIAKRFQDEVMK